MLCDCGFEAVELLKKGDRVQSKNWHGVSGA
jgi:hypothetical protein